MRNIFRFMSKVLIITVTSGLIAGYLPVVGTMASEMVSENLITSEQETVSSTETALGVFPELSSSEIVSSDIVSLDTVPEITDSQAVSMDVIPEIAVLPEVAEESVAVEEQPVIAEEAVAEEESKAVSENTVSGGEIFQNEVSKNEVSENAKVFASLKDYYSEKISFKNEATEFESSINTSSVQSMSYYSQPAWYTNSGYDAVTVYLTNDAGEISSRCFLVTDGKQWLLYDYGEYAAIEFFQKTEMKDGRYIPSQKATSRKDNQSTSGIDESKIPTMTETNFRSMVYDWRDLANVPFTRDASGAIVYAGVKKDDPTPTPTPTPDSSMSKFLVTINNNVYDVRVTKSVTYNGKKHVIKSAKATKAQTPDIAIEVYRNNIYVDPKYYTVKYGNNVNVNGYGNAKLGPYIQIVLKKTGELKNDSALFATQKFGFTILPIDIAKANFAVKKVRVVNGKSAMLSSPTATIDGLKLSLKALNAKNSSTAAIKMNFDNQTGAITVYGINNYSGVATLNLSAAKTIDWVF